MAAIPRWRAPPNEPSRPQLAARHAGSVPSRLNRRRAGFLFRLHFFLGEAESDARVGTIERLRGVIVG